jgi:hypothetical protein
MESSLDISLRAQYKRGILIPAKTKSKPPLFTLLERAFFVLDTQTGVIHIFKSLEQEKPTESLSISNGSFPEKLSNSHHS